MHNRPAPPVALVLVVGTFLLAGVIALTSCGTRSMSGPRSEESRGHQTVEVGDGVRSSPWSPPWSIVARARGPRRRTGGCTSQDANLVSAWPFDSAMTDRDTTAAETFRDVVVAAVVPYRDYKAARAAWLTYDTTDATLLAAAGSAVEAELRDALSGNTVTHLVNPDRANDGIAADPTRPDSLIYATDGSHYVLVGVMFIAPVGTDGPQFAGPLTTWHFHGVEGSRQGGCMDQTAPVAFPVYLPGDVAYQATGPCPVGVITDFTPQMLHVWLNEDSPVDYFDADMAASDVTTALAVSGSHDHHR